MKSAHQQVIERIGGLSREELVHRLTWEPGKELPANLGKLSITPLAQAALDRVDIRIGELLDRYRARDWGGAGLANAAENEINFEANTGLVIASYQLDGSTVIWVVTATDHSETAVLLSSESGVYRQLWPAHGGEHEREGAN